LDQKGDSKVALKVFKATSKSNWEILCAEALHWMNEFLAPHHFIGISIFEQDHPNIYE
jgi:hypothetical protein